MLPVKADLHGYLLTAQSLMCLDSARALLAFMLGYTLNFTSCTNICRVWANPITVALNEEL